MIDLFLVWNWAPGWLDPRLNRALMLLDLGGLRWLTETWLKVDRGVSFYNKAAIPFDWGFLVSWLIFILQGFGAVVLCQRHLMRTLRGRTVRAPRQRGSLLLEPRSSTQEGICDKAVAAGHDRKRAATGTVRPPRRSLAALGMIGGRPGLLMGGWHVARNELAEIVFSPGLYLFIPLILLQAIGASLLQVGYLDTPLVVTSGSFATSAMSQLATLVCLLLLWYTVESIERERTARLADICYSAPIRTSSLVLGKAAALAALGAAIVLTAGLAGLIAIQIQGRAPVEFRPFVLVWGLLLLPTFLVWTSFVIAVWTITRNRYTTYAIGLGVIGFTGFRLLTGEINWVGNWPLWDAIRWSDISVLELNRLARVLSRALAVGMAVFLIALVL
jgi:hypothetical protein